MKFALCIIGAATALGGCATAVLQPYALSSDFDSATARRLIGAGTGTVKGSALIRQQGGGVVTCAGNVVALIPVTSYATERMRALYPNEERGFNPAGFAGKRLQFTPDFPEYMQLKRETRCDAQGSFRFDGVAEGNFYVATVITWQVNQYIPEGGALMQFVRVAPNSQIEVVLTP